MSRNMSFDTAEILRHIVVHGTRTRTEVAKAFPGNARVDATISNLTYLGYLASDENTKPVTYSVTGKGRKRLQASNALAPRRDPAKLQREVFDVTPPRQARVASNRYRADEYAPSTRPGAMVAFGLPSRFGNTLRYRDGRMTDMDGNPIND